MSYLQFALTGINDNQLAAKEKKAIHSLLA